MKMTKVVPFAMSALLLGGAIGAPTASANEGEAVVTNAETTEQQVQPTFIKVTGTVENVDVRENGTSYTVMDGDNTNIVIANKESFIFDNTGKEVKLQKGDKVSAYSMRKTYACNLSTAV